MFRKVTEPSLPVFIKLLKKTTLFHVPYEANEHGGTLKVYCVCMVVVHSTERLFSKRAFIKEKLEKQAKSINRKIVPAT